MSEALLSLGGVEASYAAFAESVRDEGIISPDRFAGALRLELAELADQAHVHRNTLSSRPQSSKVQAHLRASLRVLRAAFEVSEGDASRAIYWFRNHPLADFGYKTPEQLVSDGKSEAVLGYLETLIAGASG